MTVLYEPDPGAPLEDQTFIALLSQRDLSFEVPINFVTLPGVSLAAACFGNRRYEDAAAAKCMSNLLATGFRRLDVDLYWDASRLVWSLCPVELELGSGSASSIAASTAAPQANATQNSVAAGSSTSAPAVTAGALQLRDGLLKHLGSASAAVVDALRLREESSEASLVISGPSVFSASSLPTVSTTSTLTSNITTTTDSGGSSSTSGDSPSPTSSDSDSTLIDVGPYRCTKTMKLSLFAGVMQEHLSGTEDTLNATTKVIIFNLHAAVPASDPTGSARQPDTIDMPQGEHLLSSVLATNISRYMYTPDDLLTQRSNLNSSNSWYQSTRSGDPDSAYFTVQRTGNIYSTPDGWPSEEFVEVQKAKRLVAGFGRTDPQMAEYNFSADASMIFPSDYISVVQNVSIASNGTVTDGCFYNDEQVSLKTVNSSWAVANDLKPNVSEATDVDSQLEAIRTAAFNLTNCGMSPILNQTLGNKTADENYAYYQQFILGNIWTWAPGQPLNASSKSSKSTDSDFANRCAVLNATSGLWQTEDCAASHYASCRVNFQPYQWTISGNDANYDRVGSACPARSVFTTPQTALENTYLLAAWRQFRADNRKSDSLLFINLNDLDVDTCWVVGQNATCPYVERDQNSQRTVIVPIVAAIIVFVLFVLTIFVKCASNRQYTRRKQRRGYDLLEDQEGVPS
ncbi:hypothetical protein K431DRAFT_337609 [Polychaeton citri CBS 116435]|uniref:Maintenance of telomere capping protein 6 n=1 Tax=Polychaeton citri CBS 116435 TaxID=1314669 RepID=A0A9P4UPE5_9PEZI|nr:hypothetical protein K431DRAFT_337609 [Polychaeton citri CBS 116435]